MSYAASNCVWIRRNDIGKWNAIWNALQFTREVIANSDKRRLLSQEIFRELIGIGRETTLPYGDRRILWPPRDAAPDRIGGPNWDTRAFFAADHGEFPKPLYLIRSANASCAKLD